MKLQIISIVLGFIFLSSFHIEAQEKKNLTLDIKTAVEYALTHNSEIVNADIDIQIAKSKVWETTAIGLPQVNAVASYTNFLDIPVQLIPNFFAPDYDPDNPTYLEAAFGTEHNMEGGVTLSQLIFNGSYIVGLQASRAYVEQTLLAKVKTEEDLKETVTQSYHMVLVTEENLRVLKNTIKNLNETIRQTKALVIEGFIDEISVSQIELMKAELDATLLNAQNMSRIAEYYLKLSLGLEINDQIILTEKLENLINHADLKLVHKNGFNLNNNIDFKIINNQMHLAELDLKNQKAAYLPVLSGFFNAKQSAMRSEFNFLDGDESWFPSTLWGIQLDVPIFSSGMKKAKVKQKRLALDKLGHIQGMMETSLNIEYENSKANYENSYLIYQNKKSNIELAQKIYNQTEIKFKEGMASKNDLNQSHDQLLQSQSAYFNAILELLNNKTHFEKVINEKNN